MKQLFFLCLLLCLLLCACSKEAVPETTTQNTDTPIIASTETSSSPPTQTTEFIPYVEELCLLFNMDDEGNEFVYRIPTVNLPGDEVEAINQDIRDRLQLPELDAGAIPFSRVAYTWQVNGEALTLLIEAPYREKEETLYLVYNLSIMDCQQLSVRALAELGGFSMEEYRAVLCDVITEHLQAEAVSEALIDRACSEETINNARPYLDKFGRLCAIVSIAFAEDCAPVDVCLCLTA